MAFVPAPFFSSKRGNPAKISEVVNNYRNNIPLLTALVCFLAIASYALLDYVSVKYRSAYAQERAIAAALAAAQELPQFAASAAELASVRSRQTDCNKLVSFVQSRPVTDRNLDITTLIKRNLTQVHIILETKSISIFGSLSMFGTSPHYAEAEVTLNGSGTYTIESSFGMGFGNEINGTHSEPGGGNCKI